MNSSAASYKITQSGRTISFRAIGGWTRDNAGALDTCLKEDLDALDYDLVEYNFSEVESLDTVGAFLFARAIRIGPGQRHNWSVSDGTEGQKTLMQAAADAVLGQPPTVTRPWYDALSRVGLATERFFIECVETLDFVGRFFVVIFKLLLTPTKIRWKSVVALIEEIGFNAVPIVMLLSFFIGAVIAYMGANLLATFGATVFMVDLVGVAVLRELAPIITAILLAGRSDSAFTAQIGAMKMRQEIDAMTVIGLDTFEVLVVPRALAALVSAPILTFLAMLSGIFGGMLVAWLGSADLSPILFVTRLQSSVGTIHLWVGLVKTPFFALIIAIIGCRQGLAVTGSVESLGTRTTTSVVQAIFAVIAVDAIFAILFFQIGV